MADVKFSQFTPGNEMMVGDVPVGLRPTSPTQNFKFDFPGAGIRDSSGNYLFEYSSPGALAVNHLKFESSLTGNNVLITAVGGDANINISLLPFGSGALILDNLKWPTSDGAPNTFLFTDGSGNLGFTSSSVTTSITGTVNQVLANGTSGVQQFGDVVLTLPQNIGTTNSPTFSGLNLNGSTSGTLSLLASDITGTNTITFPDATGTVALVGSLPTPSPLTSVNDTNVTITLGGTPATALLQSVSLTMGWSGQLGLNRGGTNASLTASNGGIVYSTASALAILSSTASAALLTNSSGIPFFSSAMTNGQVIIGSTGATPTAATLTAGTNISITNGAGTITINATGSGSGTVNTGTINDLAYYASSGTAVSPLTTVNSAALVTSSIGVPTWNAMTNGQIIIGNTGATPTAATLTAGANISITNSSGSITIAATGLGGFSWTVVTGTSQAMLSDNGYISNNAGLVTLTLPAFSVVGDEIDVIGKGAGGWKVQCGLGQTIVVGSSTTTSGGSVSSTNAKDSFYMICTVANTEWTVGSAPQSSGLTIA